VGIVSGLLVSHQGGANFQSDVSTLRFPGTGAADGTFTVSYTLKRLLATFQGYDSFPYDSSTLAFPPGRGDADGSFTFSFTPKRSISVGGTTYDCTQANVYAIIFGNLGNLGNLSEELYAVRRPAGRWNRAPGAVHLHQVGAFR